MCSFNLTCLPRRIFLEVGGERHFVLFPPHLRKRETVLHLRRLVGNAGSKNHQEVALILKTMMKKGFNSVLVGKWHKLCLFDSWCVFDVCWCRPVL